MPRFPRDDDIDAWLKDTVEIPSGPESEDEEEQDEVENNIIGNYIIGEDGVLIQNIDYLGEAQELSLRNYDVGQMEAFDPSFILQPNNQIGLDIENEPVQMIVEHDQGENETVQRANEPVQVTNELVQVANEPLQVPNEPLENAQQVPVQPMIVDDENDQPLADRLYEGTVEWFDGYFRPNIKDNFEEQVGPQVETESPIDAFSALFPDSLIDLLVYQTNLYAIQKSGGAALRNPTDSKEIRAFLGINILMGIKKLPSYRDYWSSMPEIRDSYISSVMSVNRFGWLLSNLHINDNNAMPPRGNPGYDKLYKVRPLLNKLLETYNQCYSPTRYQSVDESMVPFKGRSSLKQYMPDKPTKRGYKVWVRADSKGYVCKFEVYEGKKNNRVETALGQRLVTDMTTELVGKHYRVFFDNFFNSIPLMIYLQKHRIQSCGTIGYDRVFFPNEGLPDGKEMEHGDYDYASTRTGIVGVRWKDRKAINFVTNYHDPTEKTSVNRKQHDGSNKVVPCPSLVKDYNTHMGYVDKADMLKTTYAIDRKSRKWWHRIFFHFVDTTVVNAFVIFTSNSVDMGRPLLLKDFRICVAKSLIGIPRGETRGRRASITPVNKFKTFVSQEIRYTECAHMPTRNQNNGQRRCAHCSTKACERRSRWKCTTCDVALCLNDKQNCFEAYHKK